MKKLLLLLGMLVLCIPLQGLAQGPLGKQGVGYPSQTEGDKNLVSELGSKVRTWGLQYADWVDFPGEYCSSVGKPPMIGDLVSSEYLDDLTEEASLNPSGCFIIWNEPDISGPGSNYFPVGEAVVAWPQVRDAVLAGNPDARFIFGNVIWRIKYSNFYGKVWLEDFMTAYPSLTEEIHAWGFHFYLEMLVSWSEWSYACWPTFGCPSENVMINRLLAEVNAATLWAQAHGDLPIWITEWGQLRPLCGSFECGVPHEGQCSYQEALISRVKPQLDVNPRIEAHFWFATITDSCPEEGWCPNCMGALLQPDGQELSDLGRMFKGYRIFLPMLVK